MTDPVEVARLHARRLHRRAQAAEPDALTLLRAHPELRALPLDELPSAVKRRHALARIAVALGCRGWPHLKAVLEGTPVADKGRLMYRESAAYWNVWSASYEEASRIRAEHGGFLLPFRRQFFVAEAPYVRWMGGEPDAEEWSALGRDWVQSTSGRSTPWRRLTSRVLETRLRQALPV
ncbi:MAG: hypothetical protein AB8I08_36590 [Sandaracinaceae bacterium]